MSRCVCVCVWSGEGSDHESYEWCWVQGWRGSSAPEQQAARQTGEEEGSTESWPAASGRTLPRGHSTPATVSSSRHIHTNTLVCWLGVLSFLGFILTCMRMCNVQHYQRERLSSRYSAWYFVITCCLVMVCSTICSD